MKLFLYCTCGAAWTFEAEYFPAEKIINDWYALHTGKGHIHCNAKTAARARARVEREEERKAK